MLYLINSKLLRRLHMPQQALQSTRTYIIGTFATTIYGNNAASMLMQATSPTRIKTFETSHGKEVTDNWQRIFCGGYNKPIVYNSISLELTRDILKENALQEKLLHSLGVYLTPLLPILDMDDLNWDRHIEAAIALHTYGQAINLAEAIELVNSLTKKVGICPNVDSLQGHIPDTLLQYIIRMSAKRSVHQKWCLNNMLCRKSLEQRQICSFLGSGNA